ncbi:MAG TPA: YidC/Oxa1 family membrane protein insertase [Candidatus Paceibacterota bacterium]|nr:YidC/Oxa1 family membrane protein insertase [Candidatus Paceibacterota bacterium]
MDFFIAIYELFLYQPIFNLLIFFSQNIPGQDFGVAVILLTLAVRIVSYPLGAQAVRAQKRFAELQPKIKEIQEKFKNKKEEQTKAILEMYRTSKVNPFATFAPFLMQIPIFIVLYHIFSKGIHVDQLHLLYSFVSVPPMVEVSFLGVLNLNEQSFALALVAGVLQFVQLKQASPSSKRKKGSKPDIASLMQRQMPYIFPVLLVWVAANLPSAFGLYLATTTLFSIWQHWFITRKDHAHASETTTPNN